MEPASKNKFETPDIIVIDCDDDDPTKPDKISSSKSHKKKQEVTMSEVRDLESIYITQNVHVERQNIKCVINLNTNICKKGQKLENRRHDKSHRSKERSIERIIPKCFRTICQSALSNLISDKNRCCKHKPRSTRKHKSHSKRSEKSVHCSGSKSSKGKLKKKKSKKVIREQTLSLSSVSLSPFVSDITYEDISLDSFTCSDGELDTLIRRARERERKMCVTPELCVEKPLYSSTPQNVIELISDEETLKLNESIHSLETFVLEPQMDMAYSPTASSDHIPTGSVEEYEEEDNDIIIINTPLPTIDLTDSTLYYTDKPSKFSVNNNNIESKTNILNITTKNMLQLSKQNIVIKEKCEKMEAKAEYLKTSALVESTECKPNVAQLDSKVNDSKLPCTTL